MILPAKIGNWSVIEEAPKSPNIKSDAKLYKCLCMCGSPSIKRKGDLLKYKYCQECRIKNLDVSHKILGKYFGKWKVLYKVLHKTVYKGKTRHIAKYKCECECKRVYLVRGSELLSGNSNCCVHCRIATHKLSSNPLYAVWGSMHQRCYNKNNKGYHNYGGRGIKICKRWHTFINFFNDMGSRPPKREIDRINNDGNYEPSNCRWATRKQNSNNKRTNKK